MVKIDDIEVYLKPTGHGSNNLRFPELEWPVEAEYNGHYKSCFVPFSAEPFQIKVRFGEDFRMFKASSVLVGFGVSKTYYRRRHYGIITHVGGVTKSLSPSPSLPLSSSSPSSSDDGNNDDDDDDGNDGDKNEKDAVPERMNDFEVIEKYSVPGQQVVFSEFRQAPLHMGKVDEDVFEMVDERNYWKLLRRQPYRNTLNPGTIAVTIQRGTSRYRISAEEKDRNNAGPRPRWVMMDLKPSTFKQLRSKNGAKYRFEFRPRFPERLMTVENQILATQGLPLRTLAETLTADRYRMIEDYEFFRARERTQTVNDLIDQEYQAGVQAKPRPAPRRKIPPTCNCPKQTYPNQTLARQHPSRRKNRADTRSRRKKRTSKDSDTDSDTDAGSDTDSNKATTVTQPNAHAQASKETVARTCMRCHNLKKPPSGKKIAWRQRRERWMYVRQDAPDEDEQGENGGSSKEVVPSSPGNQDRDDEEPAVKLDGIVQPSTSVTDGASAATPTSGDNVIESDNNVTAPATIEGENPDSNDEIPTDSAAVPTTPITPPDSQPEIEAIIDNERTASAPASSNVRTHVDVDLTLDNDDSDEVIIVKSEAVERKDPKFMLDRDDGMQDLEYELREIKREKRKLEIEAKELELEAKEESISRKIAKREVVKGQKVKEEIKIED